MKINKFKQTIGNFLSTEIKYNYIDVGSSLPLNNFINLFSDFFNIYLFEPNEKEYEKLKKFTKKKKNFFLQNKAIGLKKSLSVNLYSNKNLSSVLKVNENLNAIHPKFKFIRKAKVRAVRIDDIIKTNSLSVLKIDAQGYGLECLKSAKKILNKIPIVIIEAEKYQMYKNQKLDFDIANYLHNKNFMQVGNITDYKKSLHPNNKKLNSYFKEIIYSSDILFVKNFFIKKLNKNEYILIILFLTIFHFCDLAFYVLEKSNLSLHLKRKLKSLIISRLKINKFVLKKYFQKMQQKKISLSKFVKFSSWNDENNIFSKNNY
jgi:FkbM family methyltransferase